MSDKFQSVQPGQKIRIDAGAMNAMLAAAKAHEQSKFNKQVPGSNDPDPSRVRIKNDSGEDLDRFAVVKLTGPLIAPGDNLTEFQRHIGFAGEIPSEDSGGRFAILAEPISDGRIGRGWVSGVCPVQVDVLDASHRYADTEADTHEHLVSTASGAAEILWVESGTGLKWALVRLGAGGGSRMVQFELTSEFASGSADADFEEMDGSEIGSDTLRDPVGIFASLGTGDRGLAMFQGGEYFAVQAMCPGGDLSSEEVEP